MQKRLNWRVFRRDGAEERLVCKPRREPDILVCTGVMYVGMCTWFHTRKDQGYTCREKHM